MIPISYHHLHYFWIVAKAGRIGAASRELRLGKHRLDLVVSHVDFTPQLGVEFAGRLAGSVPVWFVGTPRLAEKVRRFPSDLSRVPLMLLPPESPARKELDLYLCRHGVAVSVDVETEDSELVRFLALRGKGAAAIKERIWFICGRHPKPNPALRRSIESLMERFKLRV